MSTKLEELASKQLDAGYQSLIDEIEAFEEIVKQSGKSQDYVEISGWAVDKLKRWQDRISPDNLVGLIKRSGTLMDVTRAWTLYEEVWEQANPSVKIATAKTGIDTGQIYYPDIPRRAVIQAGNELVKKLYQVVKNQELEVELPYDSIIVVPFMNRLYTGGFDSPLPYIAAPRWGYAHAWNWVGYAHEVGHHIFRNIKGLSDELKVLLVHYLFANGQELFPNEKLSKEQLYSVVSLWYNWLEEIFADLFGILQMGPAFVKIQQYVMLLSPPRKSIRVLEKNQDPRSILLHAYDFTHPVPYLRVKLALAALKEAGFDATKREELEKRWDTFFKAIETTTLTVQGFKINDNGFSEEATTLSMQTATLEKIGKQLLRQILETNLVSLKGKNIKTVFLNAAGDFRAATIAPDTPPDDIREAVAWAVDQFDATGNDDQGAQKKKLSGISKKVLKRFTQANSSTNMRIGIRVETYIAQEGDTFTKVAKDKYGDKHGNRYELIRAANNLGKGDAIEAGKQYIIPYFD